MPDTDWIKELKPGDEVAVFNRKGQYTASYKVLYIGKHIYLKDFIGMFSPNDGYVRNSTFYDGYNIAPTTEYTRQKDKERDTIHSVAAKLAGTDISYFQAVRILEILNENNKENK